jgi:type II secretory pathway pseudopilin PulG
MTNWWYQDLKEFSPLAIILAQWVPVVTTIVLGGLFAAIIFPRWQNSYLERKTLLERRQRLVEEAAELLNSYTNVWRRLIEISKYEIKLINDKRDTSTALETKKQYVAKRSEIHDRLMACLSRATVVVGSKQRSDINKFIFHLMD